MFFESWWQGIIFGIVTAVAMLAIAWAFALGWKKYDGHGKTQEQSCDVHH